MYPFSNEKNLLVSRDYFKYNGAMERFFNTAGPVKQKIHYMLPLEVRLDVNEILMLIRQQKYFILHAPRQTGKTTALLALMELLNRSGEFRAIYVNVEPAQAARENVAAGIQAIISGIGRHARIYLKDSYPETAGRGILEESGPLDGLSVLLNRWSGQSSLPLVMFIDEIDALIGDTLISVLRQLRAGYTSRPENFPQSIVLCGVRDIRDYRIHSSATKEIITGGSAYNIKSKSLRLGDFSREEMEQLLLIHTEETGQAFAPGVFDLMWHLTRGQPWLINALAYECCFKIKENRDRSVTITSEMVKDGAEAIIRRRETHLDQLTDKLREDRVKQVIQPIVAGDTMPETISEDDIQYVEDLGLIKQRTTLEIANPMYREVIPRSLIYSTERTISHKPEWYIMPNGCLDMTKLLNAFQQFFREHSEHWLERFQYKEAGPQLLLQAFLQRIVNGGGRVEREYALGTLRTDLLATWPVGEERQLIVIELKVRHGGLELVKKEGAAQTLAYMDKCGAGEGYLVIFDKTPGMSWEERLFRETVTCGEKQISVWGM